MNTHNQAFMSILLNNFNQDGKIIDNDICIEIAHYVNMIKRPASFQLWHELYEFIYDHGESVDETYMGRDDDGEKIYHCFNPKTNWLARITEELVKLGYYKS
jgi:hypothetical protein